MQVPIRGEMSSAVAAEAAAFRCVPDPVVVELSALDDANYSKLIPELPPDEEQEQETPEVEVEGQKEKSSGCDESEQLCYWFRISQQLRGKINGSLVQSRESSSKKRERLVEAELHLFKLLPVEQLLSGASHLRGAGERHHQAGTYLRVANSTGSDAAAAEPLNEQQPFDSSQMQRLRQQSPQQQQQQTRFHNTRPSPRKSNGWKAQQRTLNRSSTTAFHLKTNLLEVSLYQILPQSSKADFLASKRATHSKAQHPKIAAQNLENEKKAQSPTLRLLDIRRMDLYSSGWETFYVKSAVEDWIRDDRLNLGLVIKAKSMFDEPIQIGLIRFADVRFKTPPTTTTTTPSNGQPIEWFAADDYRRQQVQVQVNKKEAANSEEEVSAAERGKSTADRSEAIKEQQQRSSFDSIHQPLLVIYTTTTDQQDR